MKALAALLLIGCQGGGAKKSDGGAPVAPVPTTPDHTTPTTPPPSPEPPPTDDAGPTAIEDPKPKPEEQAPEPPDPGKIIADLGAVSAWEAVVQRTNFLARRKQHGVAYGTVGPQADPPYVWLVDDTEGNGALGIRVLLGAKGAGAAAGDRVALGGAWDLDDTRHFFWRVDGMDKLPPPPKSDLKEPRPATPGHVIANGELPSGAKTIGVAKDGDAVYFTVVGARPAVDGDGWAIADELGNPAVALLNLPGERASYGSQDMRTADEHWEMKRGWQYTVRIGVLHKRTGKPEIVNARTAPIRVK